MSMLPFVQTSAIPSLEAMEEEETLGSMPDEETVKSVLRKPPEARSDEDCAVLQRATAQVKFFKSLDDPTAHFELCRVITSQVFRMEQHVFDQGDTGSTFYVIFKGGVKVYVNDGRVSSGFGTVVATLEEGESFGELALLGNGFRAATVITTMSSQLLRIEKDAYDATLQQLHTVQHQKRCEFLQRVFLFTDWSDEELGRLAKVLTSKRYEKNQTIIRQNTTTDQMYFIVSGRCRVLKRMGLSHELQEKLAPSRGAAAPLDGSMSSPRHVPLTDDPVLEICELGPLQYFGERALLQGVGTRKGAHSASVVSSTRVEVLILSKYDFYHHVDQKTQELMSNYADKFYFDEDNIRRTIHKQHRWDCYKQDLLQSVLTPRGNSGH